MNSQISFYNKKIQRLPPNLVKLLTQDANFQEALNYSNPEQPRDEWGRSARKGVHMTAKAKINPDEMSTEKISAYIGDVSSRANRHIGDRSQGDWFLRELARDQGFDGLPDVITEEQMDEYVVLGERELFRGLDTYGMRGKTGEDFAEQFRSGDLYVGKGIFGYGIYVTYGSSKYDAEGYMGTNEEGAMLRLTLKRDTKSISVDELIDIRIKDPIVQAHPELEDLGRYAAFKGYDAIDVGASKNEPDYMVILNRTAVRAQSESIEGVP